MKRIFNVAYSPQFNPVESTFSKAKRLFNERRLNNLVNKTGFNLDNEIKRVFKAITTDHCAACVRKSLHLLKRDAKLVWSDYSTIFNKSFKVKKMRINQTTILPKLTSWLWPPLFVALFFYRKKCWKFVLSSILSWSTWSVSDPVRIIKISERSGQSMIFKFMTTSLTDLDDPDLFMNFINSGWPGQDHKDQWVAGSRPSRSGSDLLINLNLWSLRSWPIHELYE